MQNTKLDEILFKEESYLTNKALHTKYKIQYVSEYAKNWVYVAKFLFKDIKRVSAQIVDYLL